MSASPFRAVDLAAALGVVLIWGSNLVAMRVGLRALTPFQLGLVRYVFAAFPLILVVPRPQVHWGWVVGYGLLQGVGQFGLLFTGLHLGMTAALASVLMQTQVFFTAFFSFALLKERPDRPLVIGLLLAGLGLACISAEQIIHSLRAPASIPTGLGLVLTLGAAAMWAASNLTVRRARGTGAPFRIVPFMVWSSLVPILPFLGMTLLFDPAPVRGAWLAVPWSGWLAAAYLGWVSTILAYALWTGLLMRHPANRVAPLSLGVPVIGLVAGVSALHESMSGWQWVGIGLIAAALTAVVLGGALRPPLPPLRPGRARSENGS
jgi:O-acetylserine/cysteine efflux transporter